MNIDPKQTQAISDQIDRMELVTESEKCACCKYYNHEFNGCNHGHYTYCGQVEGQ